MVLANLLATISRKQIAYVGVLASDTRDKVFLVQQIRKYCPDVRVFTFESDLFYAHPDFQATMQGMLVASTYPLFTRTQPWTGQTWHKRLQFPDSAAQGVYNAMLALIGDGTAYLMVDYGEPVFEAGQQGRTIGGKRLPPLWVSAVGNGGLWPVAQFRTDPNISYVFKQWLAWNPETDRTEGETGSVRSAIVLWLVLSFFCLFQALRYAVAHASSHVKGSESWRWMWRRNVFLPHIQHRREQAAYTLVCFATLLVLYVFQSSFFYVAHADRWNNLPVACGSPAHDVGARDPGSPETARYHAGCRGRGPGLGPDDHLPWDERSGRVAEYVRVLPPPSGVGTGTRAIHARLRAGAEPPEQSITPASGDARRRHLVPVGSLRTQEVVAVRKHICAQSPVRGWRTRWRRLPANTNANQCCAAPTHPEPPGVLDGGRPVAPAFRVAGPAVPSHL
jgi:hypothetical protein